jgi:hypothetical protein
VEEAMVLSVVVRSGPARTSVHGTLVSRQATFALFDACAIKWAVVG